MGMQAAKLKIIELLFQISEIDLCTGDSESFRSSMKARLYDEIAELESLYDL